MHSKAGLYEAGLYEVCRCEKNIHVLNAIFYVSFFAGDIFPTLDSLTKKIVLSSAT